MEKDFELSRLDRLTTRMLLFEYKMRKFESPTPAMSGSSASIVVEKFKRGEPLNVFGSRIAGLLVNRMFSGSWIIDQPSADRSLSSPVKTGGRSWVEFMQTLRFSRPWLKRYDPKVINSLALKLERRRLDVEKMSIYNSTSMATKDLLQLQKRPKFIKLANDRMIFR